MNNDLIVRPIIELPPAKQAEMRRMWLHAVTADTSAIGWLPATAYETRAATGDVSAVYRNGDCVGWAMHAASRSRGVMKLYQIWVRPDARCIEHGRALVAKIADLAAISRCHLIEAWVAEDLPANLFWAAIGFARTNWRWGRGPRRRKHLRWVAWLNVFPHDEIGGKAED